MQSDSRLLFDDEFDDTTNEIDGDGTFLTYSLVHGACNSF